LIKLIVNKLLTMKTTFVLCLVTVLGLTAARAAQQEGNADAAKIAREAAQAAKDQDWSKAIDGFRKAAEKDRKYTQGLAAAYSGRAFSEANDQRFQEALADLAEALKINPREARFYEQRAAVEMRINDYDKALADYGEASKLNPGEIKYHNYQAYIYETRGDMQKATAENDAALKINKGNKEALDRKQRLQKIMSQNAIPTGTPVAAPPKKPKS
jgi:tetratricopeptide (TPR) repeat protein